LVKRWALLLAAVASEVTATLSLKGALNHSWLYVVVVAGYLGAFLLLTAVLKAGVPLGVAYGIWAALGVACTGLFAATIFGEPLTVLMGVGLVLIIGGILLVELGSHAATDDTSPSGSGSD
jgi:small multidrug resistance pump